MILSKRFLNDGKPSIEMTDKQIITRDKVKEKENSGYYTFCKISCDCGNDDFDIIAEKDRYGLPVKTGICKKCGLIFSNPMYDQKSLNKFYDEDYRDLYVPYNGPEEAFFEDQYRHGLQIGEYISQYKHLDKTTHILEIGTGAGGIIKAISDKYGSMAVGIDLGREYIEFGKQHGIELYQESAETHRQRGYKYDVIILSHVIEHFLDMESELRQIKELLTPNGVIYIEVPGIKNTYIVYKSLIRSLQNAHVRYFTLDTLKQTLQKYSLSCVRGDEFIHSIFKVQDDQHSENTIKNYYQENIDFIKKNEKKYVWYIYIRPMLSKAKHFILKK